MFKVTQMTSPFLQFLLNRLQSTTPSVILLVKNARLLAQPITLTVKRSYWPIHLAFGNPQFWSDFGCRIMRVKEEFKQNKCEGLYPGA